MKESVVPSKTLIGRRELLKVGAMGAVSLAGLSRLGKVLGAECAATPTETEGPFWVDELLNRMDIRPDPSNNQVQAGLPLRLSVNVSEIQGGVCAPVEGAWVDIWHCNAAGTYSDVSGAGNPNNIGQRWLRGYQITDAHGNARFITVYPGWYVSRTVHIHFRVRKFSGATTTFNFTSQMYFDDKISDAIYASTAPYSSHTGRNPASNTQDRLFNSALMLRMSRKSDHVLASFDAVINADVGMIHDKATPTDEDSMEHMHDFGGGAPAIALV